MIKFFNFSIPLILAILLIAPSGSFSQGLENSFKEYISFIHTPQQMADWFFKDFDSLFYIGDDWQEPGELVSSRKGDCEDFATLASAVLDNIGIENDVLVIKFEGLKIKHAICIWKEEYGFYSFTSNKELVRTDSESIEGAVSKFYPDWEKIMFVDGARRYGRTITRRN